MKRLLCLLLALCLPLTAMAEEIPAHVTEQLYSNTGCTSITIDAEVIMPEVQAVPRYQVRLREFTEEEVFAMADALFGAHSYEGSHGYEDVINRISGRVGGRSMDFRTVEQVPYDHASDTKVALYHLYASTSLNTMTGQIDRVSALFGRGQQVGQPSFFDGTNYIVPLPETGPVGCLISREDAQKMADEAVASFAPWMSLAAVGAMQADIVAAGSEEDYVPDHQGWAFFYTRGLPLPVTYEASAPTRDYSVGVWRELITMVVDDDGIQAMKYEQPLEITQVLEEDSELLPFDKIMDVARTILPLRYSYEEGSYQDIRAQIDRVTLGYMITLSRGNAAYCEMLPVWDFFGHVEFRQIKDGDIYATWDTPFQSLLTVNAIDGTIIDRSYGY